MIKRSAFSPDEWREITLAPFWMTLILCENSKRAAPDMKTLFLAELGEPQLYPRFARIVFLSSFAEEKIAWPQVMQSPGLAHQKLQAVWQIIKAQAEPEEAAVFQMSLAILGRTLLKYYGTELGGLTAFQRLDFLWEKLGINSSAPEIKSGDFPAREWHQLQLSWLVIWNRFAKNGVDFSTNVSPAGFPPFLGELITYTVGESKALERLLAINRKQPFDLNQAAGFFNKLGPPAVIYKLNLLILARDALEQSVVNSSKVTKIAFTEAMQNEFFNLAQELGISAEENNLLKKPITGLKPEPQVSSTEKVEPEAFKESMITAIKNQEKTIKAEEVKDSEAAFSAGDSVRIEAEGEEFQETSTQPVPKTPLTTSAHPDEPPTVISAVDEGTKNSDEAKDKIDEPAVKATGKKAIFREIKEPLELSLETFSDYRRTGHIVSEDLQDLIKISEELNLSKTVELIKEVLERVRENSFSVAVVGEFKRGKSTFINALLGKDILPSDILPCSATLNRVTYGLKPSVTVLFKDGQEEAVEIERLADYVTKLTEESEERAATVKEAVVAYPIPYCQNNVEIIDTPGLNDEANMTEVTLSVLPQVDAAILIIMAQSPFSEYEREFLEEKLLTSDLGRVIFVVTAIDRLNRPEDADRLIKDIKRRIQKYVIKRAAEQYGEDSEEYEVYLRKIGTPRIFGLSAWQALQAKVRGDAALLMQSRFGEFEAALEKFLSQERGSIFLQVPTNRLQAASGDILSALTIREGALAMQQTQFQAAFEKSVEEIETLRARKTEELKQIDMAADRAEKQVIPLLEQLDETLKAEAARTIEAAEIEQDDLESKEKTEQLCRRISEQVARALQTTGQRYAEKIQVLVERVIAEEAQRWKEFSDSLGEMMKGIETRFTDSKLSDAAPSKAMEGLGAIAVFTGFGGIYSGYRVAGWKGVATGGAAMIATNIGTMIAVGLVSTFAAAFAGPILILGLISSYFAGGWLTKAIFGDENIKQFRESFKKTTLEQIDRHLAEQASHTNILSQIRETFINLKQKAHQEIESTLSDTQETLYEAREKRERDETLSETEQERLIELRNKVQEIKQRSGELNELLLNLALEGENTPQGVEENASSSVN